MSVEKLDWGTKGPTVTQNVDKTRLAAPQAPCQATASGAEARCYCQAQALKLDATAPMRFFIHL